MRNPFKAATASKIEFSDVILGKTFLQEITILPIGTDGIVTVKALREVFQIFPSTVSIVSDRYDESQVGSLGLRCVRVRDGGFGTNATEARSEYVIHRTQILNEISMVKNNWNFKLMISQVNLCGGTSGLSIPLYKDILTTFDDVKILAFTKLPTSAFTTFRQLQNVELFFREYAGLLDSEHTQGRISLVLYTDVGRYGDLHASQWIANFISHTTAALSTKINP
ncbi:MAG: hypothetical protein FGF48_11295, partial [Candidatus Brockarchaeota archaeon]|nr:hypothetical protein [Candidatus Brockarchaeota archaeon]